MTKFGARAMRLSRTQRAFLVFLFVGFLGAAGPALDGFEPLGQGEPEFQVWLDFDSQTVSLTATDGMPGGPGSLDFFVANGPMAGPVQVSFTYDASGSYRLDFPFSVLNGGYDLVFGVRLTSMGNDGFMHESGIWTLRTRNYVVTDPEVPPCAACPTTPGSTVEWVNWPGGDGGPTYPHCLVAIYSDEPRSGGQPMLALESGPAGSFPIN
jgi:hypothetical protein